MGIRSFFSRFRKPSVPETGTIFLTPSEAAAAPEIAAGTGATVEVPETGQTFQPSGGVVTRGSGGGGAAAALPAVDIASQLRAQEQQQQQVEEQRKIESQIKAKEVEEARQEQIFKGTIAGQLESQKEDRGVFERGAGRIKEFFTSPKRTFLPLGPVEVIPTEAKKRVAEKAKGLFIEGLIPSTPLERKIIKKVVKKAGPPTVEFLFGRTGEQFVGFSLKPSLFQIKPDITFREIKEAGRKVPGKAGFPIRVVSEFIPTTPGGVGAFIATPFLFGKLATAAPTVARVVGTGFGVSQLPTVLDPTLKLEERAAAGLGAGLGFSGAALIPTKTGLGVRAQKAQIKSLLKGKLISKETAQQLLQGVKLQKFLRKQPDVPVVKRVPEAFPKGLTIPEQEAFAGVALEGRIFGSQATRLRGLQKPGGDIDIAFKKNIKVIEEFQSLLGEVSTSIVTRRGEAVGLKKLSEKAFDIKKLSRIKEFAFFEKKTAEIPGGGKVTKLSEQFSRTLSGGIELRLSSRKPKFQKDISSAILSARGLIQEGLKELPSFPGVKQIKQFKLRRAEAKLIKFEKALPELVELSIRRFRGAGEVIPLAERKGFLVPEVETPPLVPKGKRAALGDLSIDLPQRKPVFDILSLEKQAFGKVIKPPKVSKPKGRVPSISKIPRARLGPSRFIPLALPKIEPSIIKPPKEELEDFLVPSIIKPPSRPVGKILIPGPSPEPSGFKPPKVDIKPIEGITTVTTPRTDLDFSKRKEDKRKRRRTDERKRKKEVKKRKGRERIIRPSFTGIITEQGIRAPSVGIEFEEPATVSKLGGLVDIGISPGALRGTRTGLAPRRKTKAKKKTKKKKSLSNDLGLISF